MPARGRRIGYVFQHYALFPHLTALENVAYPLRGPRGPRPRARPARADGPGAPGRPLPAEPFRAASSSGSPSPAPWPPSPRVLLLDEPFSALDIGRARSACSASCSRCSGSCSLPVVYVTHRLEDAFAVGQRLAVMRDGERGAGRPDRGGLPLSRQRPGGRHHGHHQPVPRPGRRGRRQGGVTLDWDGLRAQRAAAGGGAGSTVTAYIRPEDVKIIYPDRPLTGGRAAQPGDRPDHCQQLLSRCAPSAVGAAQRPCNRGEPPAIYLHPAQPAGGPAGAARVCAKRRSSYWANPTRYGRRNVKLRVEEVTEDVLCERCHPRGAE